jgi:hypothetical protein
MFSSVEEDVLRLEIAMYQTMGVNVLKSFDNALENTLVLLDIDIHAPTEIRADHPKIVYRELFELPFGSREQKPISPRYPIGQCILAKLHLNVHDKMW